MSGSMTAKLASGAIWMILLNSIERGLGMVSIFILARVLMPADFGIVGMATSFVYFVQLFTSFGFDVALIHNRSATTEHFNSAWTLSVLFGLVLMITIIAGAWPVSVYYKRPDVFWVICALAALPFVGGLENVGVVAFRRDLEFRREFMFQISRKLLGFLVAVPLAIWLRNYWALVAGTLAARLSGTVTSYFAHPFRPRFSLTKARELLKFTRWLLANNGVLFLNERFTDFVIGRSAGAAALGTYNVIYEFSHLPKTEIGAPINRALLPGFAKLDDLSAVRDLYLRTTGMLAMVALPAAVGLSAIASSFVPVALGDKWHAGIPVMQVLAMNGGILMFQATIQSMFISRGRPNVTMRLNLVYLAVFAPLSYWAVQRNGIVGAALATLAATVLVSPIYLVVVKKLFGVRIREMIVLLTRPAIASAIMYFSVTAVVARLHFGPSLAGHLGVLVAGILAGVATFACAIYLLWLVVGRPVSTERYLINQVRMRVRSLFVR